MKLYKIKYNDENIAYNHVPNQHQDYTLCGLDAAGDCDHTVEDIFMGKITCPRCIEIIKYCRSIPIKEIVDD